MGRTERLLRILDALDRVALPAETDLDPIVEALLEARPSRHLVEDSTFARAAGYDPHYQVLELVLTDGRVFRYARVPPQLYVVFQRAPSKGRAWHALIKGRFLGACLGRIS